MNQVNVIGIDLAKITFSICGINDKGKVLFRKKWGRANLLLELGKMPQCVVALEACGGAHYWAREIAKLGHELRILPPAKVVAFRQGQKNDQNDAEAIAVAAQRSNIKSIPVKTLGQQDLQIIQRVRIHLVHARTATGNAIKGHLLEYGIAIAKGQKTMKQLLLILEENADKLTPVANEVLRNLYEDYKKLDNKIEIEDKRISLITKEHPVAKMLMSIPGIGPITALAILAVVADPSVFKNGRGFSAWLGLVPKQYSTGGKSILGRITKHGDPYIRSLLILGAQCVLRFAKNRDDRLRIWANDLKNRKGTKLAAVALAAKLARIAWSVMALNKPFNDENLIFATQAA